MSRVRFGSADEFVGHPESRGQSDGGTAVLFFTGTRRGLGSRGFGFGCLVSLWFSSVRARPGYVNAGNAETRLASGARLLPFFKQLPIETGEDVLDPMASVPTQCVPTECVKSGRAAPL